MMKVGFALSQATKALRESRGIVLLYFLTSALEGVRGQCHGPAAPYSPGKTRYPLYRRLVGPSGPVWTGAENLAPTGIRSPDRPARSKSLVIEEDETKIQMQKE
jgi:hypothetical protein